MKLDVPLDEDWHVHSTFSDGASTLAENVAAARDKGLRRLCLTDHVRASTGWLPDYVAAVTALRGHAGPAGRPLASGPELVTGVEVEMLNAAGDLDLPDDLSGVEVVLIADHQFPSLHGPVPPEQLRAEIVRGAIGPQDAAGAVADATAAALGRVGDAQPVVAHLFSILPKLGLDEFCVPDQALDRLACRAAATGAVLEINEKWRCPSSGTVQAFASAGVRIAAGSDSHDAASIGRFASVRQTICAVAAGSA
jgi:putative hydrolase